MALVVRVLDVRKLEARVRAVVHGLRGLEAGGHVVPDVVVRGLPVLMILHLVRKEYRERIRFTKSI